MHRGVYITVKLVYHRASFPCTLQGKCDLIHVICSPSMKEPFVIEQKQNTAFTLPDMYVLRAFQCEIEEAHKISNTVVYGNF